MKRQLTLAIAYLIFLSTSGYAQVTTPNNNSFAFTQYVGFNGAGPGGTKPLDIRNAWALEPINFWTTGNPGIQRMTILANGNVGIGNTFPNPVHLLDVRNGDINTGNGTPASPQGYMIGDQYVLWHKGITSNIFVGVGAGLSNTIGIQNTFLGNDAGRNNTAGNSNTFIGNTAGFNHLFGMFNTAIGDGAGHSLLCVYDNTFVGFQSGYNTGNVNVPGEGGNTFVGTLSGFSNTNGYRNVFIGRKAGYLNTTGSGNAFLGDFAGYYHDTGNNNTYIGNNTQSTGLTSVTSYNYSTAIGSDARVTADKTMILGDNDINVGIGLSADLIPPQSKLEINYSVLDNYTAPNLGLGTGFSGLRFRDLTSNSIPYLLNPSKGVLTVDENGNVIFVPGGGTVSIANNGTSLDPLNSAVVQLGNDVTLTTAKLLNDREIPMNDQDLIFTLPATPNPAKNRIGIGMPNIASLSPEIKLEVKGSVSINDGNGNTSLFFGREQPTLLGQYAEDYGEWGIQYVAKGTNPGGLNFWKPFGSDGTTVGNGYGNFFLFLSDNGNVGIGGTPGSSTLLPGNTLEITSYISSPQPAGLRFTNLTSAGPFSTITTTNYLSVDNNGDVILVSGGSGALTSANNGTSLDPTNTIVQLGNILGATTAKLLSNREVPMNNFNLVFTDGSNTSGGNRVGIGTNAPQTKLQVINYSEAIAGSFRTNNNQQSNDAYGVEASATGGVTSNRGITCFAYGAAPKNYGIIGQAQGGTDYNYGGHFSVTGSSCTTRYIGIYAFAPLVPASCAGSWAGWFDGNVNINGMGWITSGAWSASDQILKTNIQPVQNALSTINQLSPKSFYFDTTNVYGINFNSNKHYGLIAQDVQNVLPELVNLSTKPATYDTTGNILTQSLTYLSLDYNSIFSILIQGIKELKASNDSMKNVLTGFESVMNECCNQNNNNKTIQGNNNGEATSQTDVSLSNRKIVLDQNAPNPFKEQTTITYEIKTDFTTAMIIFIDNLGEVIKEVPITQKGKGQLNVYASDLTSGIYTYTIVVDGNTIDSKKMVKTK